MSEFDRKQFATGALLTSIVFYAMGTLCYLYAPIGQELQQVAFFGCALLLMTLTAVSLFFQTQSMEDRESESLELLARTVGVLEDAPSEPRPAPMHAVPDVA